MTDYQVIGLCLLFRFWSNDSRTFEGKHLGNLDALDPLDLYLSGCRLGQRTEMGLVMFQSKEQRVEESSDSCDIWKARLRQTDGLGGTAVTNTGPHSLSFPFNNICSCFPLLMSLSFCIVPACTKAQCHLHQMLLSP